MIKHKQLFRHRPEVGQIGDCWRTCIACLLGKAPEEVPHFVQDCWNDAVTGTANAKAYLATQGLSFIEMAFQCSLEHVLAHTAAINPNTYYLLGGNSRSGVGHSVIACNDEIVWDPHPDDVGVVGPMDDGYYWICFLVPSFLLKESV